MIIIKKIKKNKKKDSADKKPFERISSWLHSRRKVEPVKVEAKTTVIRTVQSKNDEGKIEKEITKEILSEPLNEDIDITDDEKKSIKKIYITHGQDTEEIEAEPYKTYILSSEIENNNNNNNNNNNDNNDNSIYNETKTEIHHHFQEQPTDDTTVLQTFYEEDETLREVDGLTDTKEAKLIAMLIESSSENASDILRSSLESIRILKYSKSDRKDCPNVITTTGFCSAICGNGEKYKFKLIWDPLTETCKKETLVQDCIVVSGCISPIEKWDILQVKRPDYLPKDTYISLSYLIPDESKWKKDITSDGFVFYSFRTQTSQRYCPFSGLPMEDDECGIAYRFYFTQFLDNTGDSIIARGGFDRVPDIVSCETADKQQQLTERQQGDLLNHLLEEYVDETDESGPIISSLRELHITEYQANELHPMCPSIATDQSSCSSNGCSHGRKYSLTSRYSPITEVCQTLRQEPCLIVSGCENNLNKWSLLEVEKPDRVPLNVFKILGDLIPSESEWEKIRTKKGNILRVGFGFSTSWSDRFDIYGNIMKDNECGQAQRWRYIREYSQNDDAILQDFIVSDASIICENNQNSNQNTNYNNNDDITTTIYKNNDDNNNDNKEYFIDNNNDNNNGITQFIEEIVTVPSAQLQPIIEEPSPSQIFEDSMEEESFEQRPN